MSWSRGDLMYRIRLEVDQAMSEQRTEGMSAFSYRLVAARAAVMMACTLAGGALGWSLLSGIDFSPIALIVGIILVAAVGAQAGRMMLSGNPVGVPLGFAYSLLQGVFLGWVSQSIGALLGTGIVVQAVLATAITAVSVVWFSTTRWGTRTGRAAGVFSAVMVGYLIFLLINLVLSLMGVGGGWGINGLGVFGLVVCLIGCLIAAWSLNVDVVRVRDMDGQLVPDTVIWASAFSINASLMWMYLEILRLLAASRR